MESGVSEVAETRIMRQHALKTGAPVALAFAIAAILAGYPIGALKQKTKDKKEQTKKK